MRNKGLHYRDMQIAETLQMVEKIDVDAFMEGLKMNSRNKGASGERELANILKGKGYPARRGQQFCGQNGDADVVGLDGFHLECKRVEKLNLDNAMEQAQSDAREEIGRAHV